MERKVAIIIGHREGNEGAVNYLGESEYSFNTRIAGKMEGLFHRVNAFAFSRERNESMSLLAEEIAEFNPALSIELHFNSFSQPVKGAVTEALIHHNSSIQTLVLSKIFLQEMQNEFKFGIRGALRVNQGDRGYINLNHLAVANSNIASILVEPVFGNFETSEAVEFFSREDDYVKVIVTTVNKFFKAMDKHGQARDFDRERHINISKLSTGCIRLEE